MTHLNQAIASANLFSPIPPEDANYDPGNLLALLKNTLRLKSDAELSRALEVAPPVISKIRHRKAPISGVILVRMHQVSELSIKDLTSAMFKNS
jgi:plasmid maintenance system antidote protein VapI